MLFSLRCYCLLGGSGLYACETLYPLYFIAVKSNQRDVCLPFFRLGGPSQPLFLVQKVSQMKLSMAKAVVTAAGMAALELKNVRAKAPARP